MGRPTKLNPARQERIVSAISEGCHYKTACALAGVSYDSFYDWMKRGKAATSGLHYEFYTAVKLAEAEAEVRLVSQWYAQTPTSWEACARFLARRFPERWAPRRVTVTQHLGPHPLDRLAEALEGWREDVTEEV